MKTRTRHSPVPASPERAAPPSREEEARLCLGATVWRHGARETLLAGLFLLLALGAVGEWGGQAAENSGLARAWRALWPSAERWRAVQTGADLWALLPRPQDTRAVEKALEQESALARGVRPRVQEALVALCGEGNSQVRIARDGRALFFGRDCESVEGMGFLQSQWMARRRVEGVAADPVAAVLDFQRQLAARGIALIVLPVPVKPVVEGHWLAGGAGRVRFNPSFAAWVERLRGAGVRVLDVAAELVEREKVTGVPQYLQTDTHWRPEAMGAVASRVAETIRGLGLALSEPPTGEPTREPARRVEAHGDTLALLGLPASQTVFHKEPVEIAPVSQGGRLWKADPSAEILVLGDSFTNIYSLAAMGWGEAAGFAEQVSVEMGRPVDVLSRNSDGAFATRMMLQRELAAGRDRLNGKKIVVWEFASRELSFGDWRLLPMEPGKPGPAEFFAPEKGRRVRVRGTLAEVSSIPQPAAVPYREHIVSLRLVDVETLPGGPSPGRQALVYAWSMRERELTPVARLRPGDRAEFELRLWDEVAEEFEKFQRSEFADPLLAVEAAAWGEWIGVAESGR